MLTDVCEFRDITADAPRLLHQQLDARADRRLERYVNPAILAFVMRVISTPGLSTA